VGSVGGMGGGMVGGAESQSETLGQVQKSRLLGTQNLGSMNPWSLRSLPPLRPVGRKRVAGMTLKDLKCTGYI
jgi:hypothetical protein